MKISAGVTAGAGARPRGPTTAEVEGVVGVEVEGPVADGPAVVGQALVLRPSVVGTASLEGATAGEEGATPVEGRDSDCLAAGFAWVCVCGLPEAGVAAVAGVTAVAAVAGGCFWPSSVALGAEAFACSHTAASISEFGVSQLPTSACNLLVLNHTS